MSHESLYRKYRPTSFDEVVGQQYIIKILENSVLNNRVHHAYLFSGPRGNGKTTLARIFAKAINCLNSKVKPCNECENCISFNNGSFPDLIEMDAASNSGVQDIRDLIEKAYLMPLIGERKIYIIDEVHALSNNAYNALLKTLEEPPSHIVFIFATTEPQKVLETILSRCIRLNFTRVSMNDEIRYIEKILKKESYQYDVEAIKEIIKLGEGGVRDSLTILEQLMSVYDNINLESVKNSYGILSIDDKLELINALVDNDMKKSFNLINSFQDYLYDYKRLTINIINLLKESILFLQSKSFTNLTEINENYKDIIERFDSANLYQIMNVFLSSVAEYYNHSRPKLLFDVTILKILSSHYQLNNKFVPIKKEEIKEEKEITKVVTNTTYLPYNEFNSYIFEKDKNEGSLEIKDEEIIRLMKSGIKELRLELSKIFDEFKNASSLYRDADLLMKIYSNSELVVATNTSLLFSFQSNSLYQEAIKNNIKQTTSNFFKLLFKKEYEIYQIHTTDLKKNIETFKNESKEKKEAESNSKKDKIRKLLDEVPTHE